MPKGRVTAEPIRTAEVLGDVGAAEDGAVLLFLGVVRNHNDGRAVTGMEYQAYEAMATPVLEEIASEAAERCGSDRVTVVHRVGELDVGETSVAIAVSTPHRAEAYEASRYVIEEIKKRLPVWKREHYTDGERRWVPGRRPDGTRSPDHTEAVGGAPDTGRPGGAESTAPGSPTPAGNGGAST